MLASMAISNDRRVAHLQCAANEMPISLKDEVYFGPHLGEICRTRLTVDDDGW